MIRSAVAIVFDGWFPNADLRGVTEWFDLGGTLQVDDTLPAAGLLERTAVVQGLDDLACRAGAVDGAPAPVRAAAMDFVLEGLYAQKKISRSDEWQYRGSDTVRRPARTVPADTLLDRELPLPGGKKKYYN